MILWYIINKYRLKYIEICSELQQSPGAFRAVAGRIRQTLKIS